MKLQSARNESMDFEEWARLLICRKVPDGYQRLVDSKVVSRGAAILKCGDAFEVRICERAESPEKKQIVVDPLPPLRSGGTEFCRILYH
jgi:hypothetical protein